MSLDLRHYGIYYSSTVNLIRLSYCVLAILIIATWVIKTKDPVVIAKNKHKALVERQDNFRRAISAEEDTARYYTRKFRQGLSSAKAYDPNSTVDFVIWARNAKEASDNANKYREEQAYLPGPQSIDQVIKQASRDPLHNTYTTLFYVGIGCITLLFFPLFFLHNKRAMEIKIIKNANMNNFTLEDQTKECSKCNKTIKLGAKKCRYCGKHFSDKSIFYSTLLKMKDFYKKQEILTEQKKLAEKEKELAEKEETYKILGDIGFIINTQSNPLGRSARLKLLKEQVILAQKNGFCIADKKKKCPSCSETIDIRSVKCDFCDHIFSAESINKDIENMLQAKWPQLTRQAIPSSKP